MENITVPGARHAKAEGSLLEQEPTKDINGIAHALPGPSQTLENDDTQTQRSTKILPRQIWNKPGGHTPSTQILSDGSLIRRVQGPLNPAESDGRRIFQVNSTLFLSPETPYDWRCEEELLPNRIAETRYETTQDVLVDDIFGRCRDCGAILDWIPVAGPLCRCPGQAPAPPLPEASRAPIPRQPQPDDIVVQHQLPDFYP